MKLSRVTTLWNLSLAALLCMLALIVNFLWQSRLRAMEAAELSTRNLVEIVESRVSTEFRLVEGLLTHASQNLPYAALKGRSSNPGTADALRVWSENLDALLQAFPAVTHVHVFDENGLLLYSTSEEPIFSIADRPHFQRLRNDPESLFDYSGLQHMRSTGQWGLAQVMAVRDRHGKFLGVISALLKLDGLSKAFGHINVGPGGLTLLRSSRDSRLVLRMPRLNEQDFGQALPAEHPIRRRIDAGEREGSLTYTAATDGVQRAASFKRLENRAFYVQVALAEDDYLAVWRRQAVGSAALAALMMGAFGLVAVRQVRTQAQAERTLHQLQFSEQRLREAQGIAQIGSWEFDHVVAKLRWSEQMFRILETPWRHGGPVLEDLLSRVHAQDVDKVRASLESRRQREDGSTEIEYRLQFPDGRIKHVHETWTSHFDADGTRLRCVGTLQDITLRKGLEQIVERERESLRALGQRLEEGRSLLQKVIDEAPVLIMVKNLEGQFLLANAALARLYGTTPEALLGRGDADFNPNLQQVQAYDRINREVIRCGEPRTVFEEVTEPATGQTRYYQSIKSPFVWTDGQPCVLVIATDITELQRIQLQLQASEQRMAHVLTATQDGIYDWHIAQDRVEHNARWGEILGLREVPPAHPVSFFVERVHPEDRAAVMAQVQDTLAGRAPLSSEHRMLRPDGGVVWVLDRGQVVERANDGTPLRMAGSIADITARKEAQARLALAASVFGSAREGILITDAQCRIVDANEAFSRITGYARHDVLGLNPNCLRSQRQGEDFFQSMWSDLLLKGFWEGEIWNRHKSGREQALFMTITAVHGTQQQVSHYVALFSDITTAKENERLLRQFAHFDALTGLPNRVLLADRLGQAMAAAARSLRPLALAYVDLDGFKAINDTHGHEAGDQVLLAVAERMKECLRASDTIARLGGDEFVAVLTELSDQHAALPVVQRLLGSIAQPVSYEGSELHVSGSIGVSFFPQPNRIDADQLLRQADHAMYQAKLAGKNRHHVFDVHHHASLQGRYEQIERIRQALAQGEFELHYQPKVHMRSGQVLGVEALLRWRDPQRGLVPPMSFLPLIAQHPVDLELGWWVIRTALEQACAWHAQGLPLPVSVNVTGHHLLQPDFGARLQQALQAHAPLPPRSLELEVLESSALEDIAQASAVIEHCQRLGVGVALDDFGTGYSTLTHLKRLPARVLKIDRSFVQNMLHDTGDLTILEGVIGLAKAFFRSLVAEGVESVAHGRLLLQLGCEVGQGYVIARPMPSADVAGWLASWRPDPVWTRTQALPAGLKPALYALVEHRAWMQRWRHCLAGHEDARTAVAAEDGPLSFWLKSMATDAWLRQPQHELRAAHARLQAAVRACIAQWGLPDAAESKRLHQDVETLHERVEALLQGLLEPASAKEAVVPA